MTFPLPLADIFGHWGQYVIFALLGFGFGWALEIAGFGNSKKLAAQFYFKEMTVLKVMFTAIVVAMVLIFLSSAVGLLDFNLVWVNHTYLWPGIVGGLVMGVGFIVGGFCPGTSLVSAFTGKIDGIFFVLGVLFGIFLFGETVGLYEDWWYSSNLGRFTIPEWLGLDYGLVVVLIVLMALFMFWGSEHLERIFGGMDIKAAPKWRYGAAGGLLALAVVVMIIGHPTASDRWTQLSAEKETQLANREVQIEPGELYTLMYDPNVQLVMLDVRSETDYNLFHLVEARHVPMEDVPAAAEALQAEPANTVVVVMSNDEAAATEAWKALVAGSVSNAYILGGGINGWLETFEEEAPGVTYVAAPGDEILHYRFMAALGSRLPAAQPNPYEYTFEFEPKVKLQGKRGPLGSGCGS